MALITWVSRRQGSIRSHAETPESRTQVAMITDGVLEVHDNVVFEANTAEESGGAVSLPFEIGSHLPGVALWVTVGTGRFDSGRQLMAVSEALMLTEICWVGADANGNARPEAESRTLTVLADPQQRTIDYGAAR